MLQPVEYPDEALNELFGSDGEPRVSFKGRVVEPILEQDIVFQKIGDYLLFLLTEIHVQEVCVSLIYTESFS